MVLLHRPLSQVGSRRKRCPGQFGQDGIGSIPATPSTKHASCFPPSSMPASIEISIKLIVLVLLHAFLGWGWLAGQTSSAFSSFQQRWRRQNDGLDSSCVSIQILHTAYIYIYIYNICNINTFKFIFRVIQKTWLHTDYIWLHTDQITYRLHTVYIWITYELHMHDIQITYTTYKLHMNHIYISYPRHLHMIYNLN